ncbi:TonB-dependent receptor [Alteromonas sp. ASW11-130]|uniref:TonB-dependent receptor n=1 Tax=Alteromonas sp. ASW11-130 TaxID=3015775 RepID=UPI0022423536|nr:TonB-dependent receptor [Alteromonas sp. ASW11-130]MCW8093139.1 TonB-dependent receptor [Alteromonas sp. ASW11-130]
MKNTLIFTTICLASNFSFAEETPLEVITVTGDFRQANLDQLNSSASIISEQQLNTNQAQHIEDILNIAPNVNFTAGASRGRFVQIRGIGERSQFAEPINPSVTVMVDEFDFSGLAGAALLFDTQQVEIFRGPQATLFGTGALAGAIKVVSHKPFQNAPGKVEVSAAGKNTYRFEVAHGDKITEDLAYRAAVVHNRSDGFITNTYLGRDDTNNIDESAARLGISLDMNAQTNLAVNYRWYDIDNGYDAFSLDNDRFTRSDEPGFDSQLTHAISANVSHINDLGAWQLVVTQADHDIGYGYDEDWTYPGFHPWGYTSFDAYYREVSTSTADLRLVSSEDTRLFDNTTEWVAGIYYKTSEQLLRRQYTYLETDFTSTYEPDNTALYVRTDTALWTNLNLQIGIRAEQYEFDYLDSDGGMYTKDTSMVGGKLALEYITDQHFWYASVSRGFKGPGVNSDQEISDTNRFYDEEYNWNYEIGVKGPITSDMTGRLAVFHMRRKSTQVSGYELKIREDNTPAFIDFINNADIGTNEGLEAELNWYVLSNWQIQASLGYLNASFERYQPAEGAFILKRRQAQSPRFTGNVFSELAVSDNVYWRVNVDYKDEFFFSDGHDEVSPTTTLVNTELAFVWNNWQTKVWLKNAFDKRYYVRGFGGFSNDPREFYETPKPYYQLGDGRQLGVTVSYQF